MQLDFGMKSREAGTYEDAVTRIIRILGADVAARAVGRSQSLVRKWADPDDPALPNIEQATALDVAFVSAGCGEAPILGAYLARIEHSLSVLGPGQESIIVALIDLQSDIGKLTALIADAIELPRNPGRKLDVAEKNRLLRAVGEIRDGARGVERAIIGGSEQPER